MLIIGLTGGIGSGKTTVTNLFADLGTPIIDADIIARELVTPGQPALDEITSLFGQAILNSDGSLNRVKLRQQVFSEPDKRKQLEAILHPRIRHKVKQHLSSINASYCIVVIPLLIETNYQYLIQRILVVDSPEELQIKRTIARDNNTEDDVRAIIATQAKRKTRLEAADDVLLNDGDTDALKQKVTALHQYYLDMARIDPTSSLQYSPPGPGHTEEQG